MNKILLNALVTSIAFHLLLLIPVTPHQIKSNKNQSSLLTNKSVITIWINGMKKDRNKKKKDKPEPSQRDVPVNSHKKKNPRDDVYLSQVRMAIEKAKFKNSLATQLNLKGEVVIEFTLV